MAIDNYGRVMQDSAEFAMMPYNALMQSRDRERVLGQRDEELRQRQVERNALAQRYSGQQAQAEEDDSEWDAAYAQRDWGTMLRIDPQSAKALYEFEQAQKPPASVPIEEQTLPSGRVLAVQGGKPVGSPWARPERTVVVSGSGPIASPKLVKAPEGYRWTQEGEELEAIPGGPKDVNATQSLSPKDTNTARVKLTQVSVARRQLKDAKAKYAALKGTLSAGPGGNLLPTPKGKAYDAAIDTMRSSISALTRVPGVGAMSDYETRLDQAKFPTRGNYEEVGEQQLQALEDQLNTIEENYRQMLGGSAPATAEPSQDGFPPASENKGRKVRDTDTGKVFRSDGNSWIPQ